MRSWVAVTLTFLSAACGGTADPAPGATEDTAAAGNAAIERVLAGGIEQAAQLADSVDRLLRPAPLLTPAQEAAMRRYGNAQQLERARELGARPADSAQLRRLLGEGRLVEIRDSTPLWAVRELEHSLPYVTPDTHTLLERIATRFQEQLAARGLPQYRVEVTSVLRSEQSQADLRRTNVNAAAGASTHEYGTTLDLAYSSFAAPMEPPFDLALESEEWLAPHLERITAALLETAAARKSRELQAILGGVLLEMQSAGDLMVTLEVQQPVYHLTVARRQR